MNWLPPTPEAPHPFADVLMAVHGAEKSAEGFRDHCGGWWYSTGNPVPENAVYAYAELPDCPVIPQLSVPAATLLDGAHSLGGAA